MKQQKVEYRWVMLAIGVFAMLFAGVIYAWSILKVPFANTFGFTKENLSMNFTLTMSFFCIGGVVSSAIVRQIGTKLTIAFAGILAGLGFVLTGFLQEGRLLWLYMSYAVLSGFGIGVAYIVIISTVNAWFPDRKGLSSGALMMGFGASTLLLGNVADALFATKMGWRNTYILLGVTLGVVILFASLFIYRPEKDTPLPPPRKPKGCKAEDIEIKDYAPGEMLTRFTFWRAFLCFVCITAVGSSVISFARDLALSVGAGAALATTLVGVLAVCNGLGRILTGALFDAMGRRFTMLCANLLTIVAASITLLAVSITSLPLAVIGLCLTGMSYGTSPTMASAFVMSFYGQKHFATNLGMMNFNLMVASFVATACSALLTATGSYFAPFVLLLAMSFVALGLNLSIKKP